ncbi:MAG TPA: hypothetical protein VFW19_11605 [Allosphingosinicella sp.]|nr:hypothetical protein [Allosphingosinicella sp.]
MMMVLFFTVPVATIPAELGRPWAEFSREPAGHLITIKVEVGTLGYDHTHKQLDFWLRRSVVKGFQKHAQVTWADTRTCIAARPVLASMRNITVPKFAPVGSSPGSQIVLDGVSYSLSTYSDEGKLTAETNVNTPVAAWIELALKDLDSCWTSVVPERTR